MNLDKQIILRQQKRIEDLKAELAYWKDTAEFYLKEATKTLDN